MSGDLVSLQLLVVSAAAAERELWRAGANFTSVPVKVTEASDAASACALLAKGGVDLTILDFSIGGAEAVIAAAQSAPRKCLVVMAAHPSVIVDASLVAGTEGAVPKPANIDAASDLVERCIKLKLAIRVLIVDDSGTMRSIVRKILSNSRYKIDVSEVEEGIGAIKRIRDGSFDLIFLDYNMPGLNGIETLSEIKRENPRLAVVMITSTVDAALAERARAAGALAFLKKPFYPADIDAVLKRFYGLRVPGG
jgi:DNA-binding NarL/FixJ family response regulator